MFLWKWPATGDDNLLEFNWKHYFLNREKEISYLFAPVSIYLLDYKYKYIWKLDKWFISWKFFFFFWFRPSIIVQIENYYIIIMKILNIILVINLNEREKSFDHRIFLNFLYKSIYIYLNVSGTNANNTNIVWWNDSIIHRSAWSLFGKSSSNRNARKIQE